MRPERTAPVVAQSVNRLDNAARQLDVLLQRARRELVDDPLARPHARRH